MRGGVGGTVIIRTHRPLDIGSFKTVASVQGSYDDFSESLDPRVSGLVSNVFADGKVGALLSASFSERELRQDAFRQTGYRSSAVFNAFLNDPNIDALEPSNTLLNSSSDERKRVNVSGVLQFRPTDNLNVTLEGVLASFDSLRTVNALTLPPQRGGYVVDSLTVDSTGAPEMLTISNNFFNFNTGITDEVNDLEVYGANVEWTAGKVTLDADVSYSKATSVSSLTFGSFRYNRPEGVTLSWDYLSDSNIPDISILNADGSDFVLTDPDDASLVIRDGRENFTDIDDEEFAVQLDLDYEFDDNNFGLTTFETGIKYRDREFERFVSAFDYRPSNGSLELPDSSAQLFPQFLFPLNNDDFLGSDNAVVPSNWLGVDAAGVLAFFQEQYEASDDDDSSSDPCLGPGSCGATNYTGSIPNDPLFGRLGEEALSLYAKVNFEQMDGRLSGNAGIRWVKTEQDSVGIVAVPIDVSLPTNTGDRTELIFVGAGETTLSREYDELLWNINLNYELTEEMILRFGAARVMSRPDVQHLSPAISGINTAQLTITRGNPNLDPFIAVQGDVSFEWYFDEAGLFNVAAFYKDIKSAFQTLTVPVTFSFEDITQEYLSTQPENSMGGNLYGFEIGIQKDGFLPGAFSPIGVVLNYTFVDSGIESINALVSGQTFSLEGLSKNNYNASVYYETDKFGARLSYNFRDEFLLNTLGFQQNPEFRDSYGQLDGSLSYQLSDNIGLTLEAINLGNSNNYTYSTFANRPHTVEYTGRRVFIGARYHF